MSTQVGRTLGHRGRTPAGSVNAVTRTALCVGLGLASACVANTDGTTGERDDGALASGAALTQVEGGVVYARLMHTLDLGGDHRVQFFDAGGGTYGVRETMPLEDAH